MDFFQIMHVFCRKMESLIEIIKVPFEFTGFGWLLCLIYPHMETRYARSVVFSNYIEEQVNTDSSVHS